MYYVKLSIKMYYVGLWVIQTNCKINATIAMHSTQHDALYPINTKLEIGDKIETKDFYGKWHQTEIIEIYQDEFKIQFPDWDMNYNGMK